MRRKRRVPEVLWRLFRDRACTMADTILSLIPSPSSSAVKCRCDGLQCLGCSTDPMSFLLRPDDPHDYRKLLTQCFVVVSDNAPPRSVFSPRCSWPIIEIVKRTIELVRNEKGSSNVICSGYDKIDCLSPILELLTCSSWGLLLSRVGDDLMVYLLRHTSIFLPVPLKRHRQVAGPPISTLCFKMHSTDFDDQHPSLLQGGAPKKRKSADNVESAVDKQRCIISIGGSGPTGSASNLDLTAVKSSMPLLGHNRSKHQHSNSSYVKSNTELEGKQNSNYISTNLGKRSRPFRWQRQRKWRQLSYEENNVNIHYNVLPTNKDCLPGSFQCNKNYLSYHEKMPWECSCCSILQSLSTVPKRTVINRKSIFFNLESSLSVLPKEHILNSLRPNLVSSRYLISNIFGLSEGNAGSQPMHCFHKSTSCPFGSVCLYHSLISWFKGLICRAQHCDHIKLLDRHCFVPSWDQHTIGRYSSSAEGNVSETTEQKKSKSCVVAPETIDLQYAAVNSYCSKSQVVSYIWAVSRSLLPQELLGTPSNWRRMRRNIYKFINLRKFEKSPLKLCMQELKTSRFQFLSDKYFFNDPNDQVLEYMEGHNGGIHKGFKKLRSGVHDMKHKLLEKWILWYFSCLVMPLVKANFYVTESEHGKQDVYYYRKSVWEKLTKSTIACLKDQRYRYLDDLAVRNILRRRPFGFSKLRLLPKENGVRMVANLKGPSRIPVRVSSGEAQSSKIWRKSNPHKIKFDHYQSVNSVLRDAHSILKAILLKEPEKLGASVFDYNDVYKKLCPFLIAHKKGAATMPSLFIVTSDVSKAFDSIDQEKLLIIMKDIFLQDDYFLKRYDQVVCTRKFLRVQKHLKMLDENTSAGCLRLTSSASFLPTHTVFVNQDHTKHVKKTLLFTYLNEHVKCNILLLDRKFYLQGVGIPQGGVLSSLLCSLYYGHLDRNVIFPFLEKTLESGSCKRNHSGHTSNNDEVSSQRYMLIRLVDDFLFISTSEKQATSFFSRLQRGFRDYNCYMNEKKFGLNFDHGQKSGVPLSRVYLGEDGTSFLRWSGLLINCCTSEVQADYTKYLSNHLSSTLTVCWQGKPGLQLKEKLRGFVRPKCHPIFFDSNINSGAVVRLNIYQIFLLCAMKFHCYIRDLSYICKLHHRCCLDGIERSLSYMHRLIRKRMHSMDLDCDFHPILRLEKGEVIWLGLRAYIQVLKRKQSFHKQLLALLRSKCSSHTISGRVSPELKYAIDASKSSLLWKIKY
ncbi:hypothetical protein L6164_023010 [Bauhinia variegata]|uniref:Uncharacterized protein n=1 Tax=Bauhinia variegata TaxID=167791 RepID=A0ACB9MGU2_BAUVA|nr:hypothetical protein L6164_023010 [Bauhinia variegata]